MYKIYCLNNIFLSSQTESVGNEKYFKIYFSYALLL